MRSRHHRTLLVVTTLLSMSLVSCFGGKHGGGGGGGNGGGGNGGGGNSLAVFQITKTHTGNFFQGQQRAAYTITVTNAGNAPTSGAVVVADTLPPGETLVGISGTGWSFPGGPMATRSDSLAPGQSFPQITLRVDVAVNAASPQVNMVNVSGGGLPATASDPTTVITPVLSGQYAFFLSGFDTNGAMAVAGSITVDANGNITGEEDFKDPTAVSSQAPSAAIATLRWAPLQESAP